MSRTSLLGLPAEVRCLIYHDLFPDAVYEQTSARSPDPDEDSRARRDILSANKQLRREALPIFQDHLTLRLLDCYETTFPAVFRKIENLSVCHEASGLTELRCSFPRLERVDYLVEHVDCEYASLYAKDIEAILSIMSGGEDDAILECARPYIEKKLEYGDCKDSEDNQWESWISTIRDLPYEVVITFPLNLECMLSCGVEIGFAP